ncbi:MAG: HEAT repeat domain-containing protein [Planctomycetes bacterium]|nr:HEAT repeat domain-containing protein [Planctomycetota bacterium]
MIRHAAPALFSGLCLLATVSAHGGQYRGPGWGVPPGARSPLPPSTGGPAGPAAPIPGPNTGGRPVSPDTTSWQVWWEFNKEIYLGRRRVVDEVTISGSDDFYLGKRRAEVRIDLLSPTEGDLRDRVVPALAALLAQERNRDIQSACLIALAKIGRDGPGIDLEATMTPRIARDDQEVRETAVLALGIAGRKAALGPLAALVRDDGEGRRLVDRLEVGDRTRAFAAYALGVLARRSDDGGLKQQVHDLLLPLLGDPETDDRDLRTAAVTGLGLLRGDTDSASHKRLAWQTVEELMTWYQRDLGRGDELVQAHAPVAIARLLGRGTSVLHQRCKEHFAAVLTASERRSNAILQSAALALGMLAVPAEQNAADLPFSRALQTYYERGHDRQARSFCTIALGRIGGATNRTWLLTAHARANNATERPWTALALGLIAHAARQADAIDTTIAQLLLEDLRSASNDDVRSALAVATGLCGDSLAVPAVLALLREHEGDERPAGYLCVALALLDDPSSAPTLSEVLERSLRRPFLLQQSAVALGCLGDKDASTRLLDMMRRSDSVAALSAIAIAIGEIGDARSIDPLIAQLRDEDLSKLARAFVAAALGGVGDKDELRWNTPLSRDGNYAAAVDTLTNGATGVLDIL